MLIKLTAKTAPAAISPPIIAANKVLELADSAFFAEFPSPDLFNIALLGVALLDDGSLVFGSPGSGWRIRIVAASDATSRFNSRVGTAAALSTTDLAAGIGPSDPSSIGKTRSITSFNSAMD